MKGGGEKRTTPTSPEKVYGIAPVNRREGNSFPAVPTSYLMVKNFSGTTTSVMFRYPWPKI